MDGVADNRLVEVANLYLDVSPCVRDGSKIAYVTVAANPDGRSLGQRVARMSGRGLLNSRRRWPGMVPELDDHWARQLLDVPDSTPLKGKGDRAMLSDWSFPSPQGHRLHPTTW
jgi:hypothetical protein